jgi:hypothetical protein
LSEAAVFSLYLQRGVQVDICTAPISDDRQRPEKELWRAFRDCATPYPPVAIFVLPARGPIDFCPRPRLIDIALKHAFDVRGIKQTSNK